MKMIKETFSDERGLPDGTKSKTFLEINGPLEQELR
jgi:hypothetical protein